MTAAPATVAVTSSASVIADGSAPIRYPCGAGGIDLTLAGSPSRYQNPTVATVPPGLIEIGVSLGKPCIERSTMPPASVHMNGAPLGGKFWVVDQPTTRLT